jgi:hypothetical protein
LNLPLDIQLKDLLFFVTAAALAYALYRRGLNKKRLSFCVRQENLLVVDQSFPNKLKILYDKQEIQNLRLCEIYIWNAGRPPITRADLQTNVPLKLKFPPHYKVLQTSIVYQTRGANDAKIKDGTISFAYLNEKDGLVIEVLAERNEEIRRKLKSEERTIMVEGEIIGMNRAPTPLAYQASVSRAPALALALCGLLTTLLMLGGAETSLHRGNLPPLEISAVVVAMILALGGTAITAGACVQLTAPRIPYHLRMKGEEPAGLFEKIRARLQ